METWSFIPENNGHVGGKAHVQGSGKMGHSAQSQSLEPRFLEQQFYLPINDMERG